MMKKYLFSGYLLLITSVAIAQTPNYFLYDDYSSSSFGGENLISIHELVYSGLDSLIPPQLWDEKTIDKKIGGVGYRLLKFVLLDLQIDFLAALTQHEAFGHGSRMRASNHEEIAVFLSLFAPYGESRGFAQGRLKSGYSMTNIQSIMIAAGGNEGNLVLSKSMEERMLLQGKIKYHQGLLYLIARNNLLHYVGTTHLFDRESGDIFDYITRINTGIEDSYNSKKLFMQNLIALANPIQIYSMWALGKKYILDGQTEMNNIPFFEIKNIQYLPAFNYNLTPFGSEFILNQYLVKDNKLLLLQARLGDNTFHSFYGAGIRALNIIDQPKFLLNAEAHFWSQPEFEIGVFGGTKTFEEGLGGMATCSFSWFPAERAKKIGVFGLLGYKTGGYIMGEKLDEGLIMRIGLAMDFNNRN